jgi:hypothetical protein
MYIIQRNQRKHSLWTDHKYGGKWIHFRGNHLFSSHWRCDTWSFRSILEILERFVVVLLLWGMSSLVCPGGNPQHFRPICKREYMLNQCQNMHNSTSATINVTTHTHTIRSLAWVPSIFFLSPRGTFFRISSCRETPEDWVDITILSTVRASQAEAV